MIRFLSVLAIFALAALISPALIACIAFLAIYRWVR